MGVGGLCTGLAVEFGSTGASRSQRPFQLLLGYWLLAKYALQQLFQGSNPGFQTLELARESFELRIIHALVSTTTAPQPYMLSGKYEDG